MLQRFSYKKLSRTNNLTTNKMENEIKAKSTWQKPEIIDLNIDLTSKLPSSVEYNSDLGPNPS